MIVGDDERTPRPEYPRPQFARENWRTLNGWWQFEVDQGDTGLQRGLLGRRLASRILVPFAPESAASGVGLRDQLRAVWYRRTLEVPADWAGNRVVLHFGAVDHDATVWVGGSQVGRHRGGFTSFSVDITEAVPPGHSTDLVVRARDTPHDPQARGKQGREFIPNGTFYPRTTGIWQSVWMEPVPLASIRSLHVVPVVGRSAFRVSVSMDGARVGRRVEIDVRTEEGAVAARGRADVGVDLAVDLDLVLDPRLVRLWAPGHPHLYGIDVRLVDSDGRVLDRVASYAGLRSVAIDGQAVLLNGEPVFQRLVLDQGYWPETLMTAPSDEALAEDIRIGLEAGFNGARAHQKVFEERYLYHADRLGYLVWAEFGDWGVNEFGADGWYQTPTASFLTQWLEAIGRDRNHPAIIGWCGLNESQERLGDRITVLDDVTRGMFLAARLADPTRLVLDASGFSHRVSETDVYDSHSYQQDPAAFRAEQAGLAEGIPFLNTGEGGQALSTPYRGQPYFVSEFGGIHWSDDERTWGYGDEVGSLEELYERFAGLVAVLRDDPHMFGYCYTQLSDVETEHNGIVHYDRSPKLDRARLRVVQEIPAAIEIRGRRGGNSQF